MQTPFEDVVPLWATVYACVVTGNRWITRNRDFVLKKAARALERCGQQIWGGTCSLIKMCLRQIITISVCIYWFTRLYLFLFFCPRYDQSSQCDVWKTVVFSINTFITSPAWCVRPPARPRWVTLIGEEQAMCGRRGVILILVALALCVPTPRGLFHHSQRKMMMMMMMPT